MWMEMVSGKEDEARIRLKHKEAKDKMEAEKLQNRLHKAKDAAKGILTPMPDIATDLPAYFENVERNFHILQIAEDLKLLLLQVHLTPDARKLIAENPNGQTYEQAKAIILRANKLSPAKYRQLFNSAAKTASETYTQFVNRLSVGLNYYLKSRDIQNDYRKLFNMLVCDKLKDTLDGTLREQVRVAENNKAREFSDLAEYLDNYVSETNFFEEKVPEDAQGNINILKGASGSPTQKLNTVANVGGGGLAQRVLRGGGILTKVRTPGLRAVSVKILRPDIRQIDVGVIQTTPTKDQRPRLEG